MTFIEYDHENIYSILITSVFVYMKIMSEPPFAGYINECFAIVWVEQCYYNMTMSDSF